MAHVIESHARSRRHPATPVGRRRFIRWSLVVGTSVASLPAFWLGEIPSAREAGSAGRPPACVAACPNRAFDFWQLDDRRRRFGRIDRIYPLEDPVISRPAVVFIALRHAAAAAGREPEVANWEEL